MTRAGLETAAEALGATDVAARSDAYLGAFVLSAEGVRADESEAYRAAYMDLLLQRGDEYWRTVRGPKIGFEGTGGRGDA